MTIESESNPTRSNVRLRFSLLAIFIFVTLVCLILAWIVQPNRVIAMALFRVSSEPESIVGDDQSKPGDNREYETYKKTQIALLKSYFVLNAAMRKPGIAALPIFQNQKNPEDWLERNLEVEFPEEGEVLSISLRGPEAYSSDLVRIVDAVAHAYSDEVVYRERAMRAASRDTLNRSLETLKKEIAEKKDVHLEISRDSGSSREAKQAKRQLALNRLDRVDSELIRLENEQAMQQEGGDSKAPAYFEKRIAQLRDQQGSLEKELLAASEESAELSARQAELQQLQNLADDLTAKMLRIEIDANAPQRIEQLQPAMASPVD